MTRVRYSWLLLVLLLCAHTSPFAATYTVSPLGDDSTNGSAGTPWRTIQHAANSAVAGDTVMILPGTYAERIVFPRSGTVGNPITFMGTRGNGTWETIIDGSTPVTAPWTPAPDVGNGVFQATLGYSPGAMTANNLGIWRIGDHQMGADDHGGGSGNTALARGPTEEVESHVLKGDGGPGTPVPVPFWNGIEALFGSRQGVTFLRFRNREHPSTMNVRAAPGGAVLSINGKHFLTIRNLKVQGGQWAVHVRGGAQNTIIDQCYLVHGQHRLLNEFSTNTILSNSTLTYEGIGFANHTPGDWNTRLEGGPARIVNRHQYNLNKFLVGDTGTDDSSISVTDGSLGLVVTGNRILNSMAGITFNGSTSQTVVSTNQIFQHSDNCVYISQDSVSATFHHNLLYDCDHLVRMDAPDNRMEVDFYANMFWQPRFSPESTPKHLYVFPRPSYDSGNRLRIYHNTFAGGGTVSAGAGTSFMHFRNNLISVKEVNDGGASFGTFQDNHFTPLWFTNTRPDFVLPLGHGGRDNAPSLIALGWPGITTAYYGDGQPDYGAMQGEGSGLPDPPPIPPPPPVPPPVPGLRVTMGTPMDGSTVSGQVTVSATATGAVGVQFLLDGAPLKGEQCCTSLDVSWNTTTASNGSHTLAARARNSAGQQTTTPAVTVIVANGVPVPPPVPPVVPPVPPVVPPVPPVVIGQSRFTCQALIGTRDHTATTLAMTCVTP